MGRPGRLPRAPLPAASPGPVPCPPMPAPASWVAAPHRPARHGPLEAETGLHLGMRGDGRGRGLLRSHLSARTVVLRPYLRSPPGASRGCPQGWALRLTSGRALLPGAATQTDWLAGAALGAGRPGPATTPPTLTPSEPACRVWAPLLRPTAALLKLPLRSPPASTREYQLLLACLAWGKPCRSAVAAALQRPPTCKRLPQHPDLFRRCGGSRQAASLGWAWFGACSGTCEPSIASLSPGPARVWEPDTEKRLSPGLTLSLGPTHACLRGQHYSLLWP